MSKKSSARTGSEGDADSTTSTEVFTNIYSGSSSCKSKRDIEAGPFGDIEHIQRNQEHFKDFLILMFQENEEQSDASHSTDEDQILYDLKNDYLEKLNIVRKRLNLVELSNNEADNIPPLSYSGCKITEIVEQGSPKSDKETESKKSEHDIEEKEGCSAESNNSANMTDTYELNTIYSPSPSYINSADSVSATNFYDLDYNPPKKKFCHRLRTPKFSSASEGNIPYYTKVTLREDLFKIECDPISLRKKPQVVKRRLEKFTRSKATQCTEEEEEVKICRRMSLVDKPPTNSKDINLFPKVIIEVKEEENRGDVRLSPRPSKKYMALSGSQKDITNSNDIPPLNFVRTSSDDESYVTITTNTTIINSPKKKKVKKRKFKGKTKVTSGKLSLWEEVRKLHFSQGSAAVAKGEEKSQQAETVAEIVAETVAETVAEEVAANTGECNSTIGIITKYINELSKNAQIQRGRKEASDSSEDTKENTSLYIRQYLKYKASLESVKSGVVFGGNVVTNINRFQTSRDNNYYSGTSLISDEDRRSKDFSSSEDVTNRSKEKTVFKTFWRTLCPRLPPKSRVFERFWKTFCPCLVPKSSD